MNVVEERISDQQGCYDERFPLVLVNPPGEGDGAQLRGWLREKETWLRERLGHHGAILFRGFPCQSDSDFDGFVEALGCPNFRYRDSLSNAVRVNRTERVFTANEAPPEVTIFLHHEMAQTPIYPSSLFFFCEQAAEAGGATPLCRSDVLLDRMRREIPGFVSDCESKGLRYTNTMPGENDPESGMGRSWQSTLSCETRAQAEERLRQLGYQWTWEENHCLRVTTPRLPAIRELASGRQAFFNQLIAASKGWKDNRNDPSKAVTHGDGSLLDHDAVRHAAAIADELSFDLCWQTGDVAWVDNFTTMHGRRTFSGTRKVLASLVASETEHR